MVDYSRSVERFFYRGISLLPADALPEGKSSSALNIRSYQEGTVTPRFGLRRQSTTALPDPIHSLFRLNDSSAYFAIGAEFRRFAGAGDTLYVAATDDVPSAYTSVYSGFSGDPMTAVSASPVNSPRPFLYVADSLAMRKINSSLNDMPIGIETPTIPPVARLAAVQSTFLESVGAGFWSAYGGGTSASVIVARVTATVDAIVYDVGTTGMASVELDDMTGIVPGTTVDIGASPLTVIVQDVVPPVSSTTIGRILYDAGTSGLCTIQPAGSISAGQIEMAMPEAVRRRYEDLDQPVPARITVSRTIDFPVYGLITVGGTETVQILSVSLGTDGVMSFRCLLAGTHAAGAAIVGLPAFRAYFSATRIVGDPATSAAVQNVITAPSATVATVGGIQAPVTGGIRNWALVGTQASQPSDIIRLGIRVSALAYVQAVRLMLDVDLLGGGPSTFLENYYFYEWRANDLLAAIPVSVGAATELMSAVQSLAIEQGQADSAYGDQYGQEPSASSITGGVYDVGRDADGVTRAVRRGEESREYTGRHAVRRTDSFVTAGGAPSRQLSLGDNQWIVLQCRIGDLTRVGTDATRTLAHINSAAVALQMLGTVAPITVEYSDAYLTGGYGPDVGMTLPPYVYRYSGRSTITGERGNPSPPMRAGVHPRRGRVILTPGAALAAAQCDVIDWWRYGGALARWQYVRTQPNTLTSADDDMADREIDGGESIRTDLYQPWPSNDLPRSGTAILAGTALQWVSGDVFNPAWGVDTAIIVNGRATSLYRQPVSTTRLEVIDNCGEGAAVAWSMPAPTLLARPLPVIWGGPINNVWFNFAIGDPVDPGLLHWTHGNDPDATSPRNTLVVTTASEPLMNGFFYDGVPYVFTTERLLRIVPTFGDATSFRCVETACTKGLWGRWAMAIAPEGVYFLSRDGIYVTAGGSEAQSITAADLKPAFPQDGSATISGV